MRLSEPGGTPGNSGEKAFTKSQAERAVAILKCYLTSS